MALPISDVPHALSDCSTVRAVPTDVGGAADEPLVLCRLRLDFGSVHGLNELTIGGSVIGKPNSWVAGTIEHGN